MSSHTDSRMSEEEVLSLFETCSNRGRWGRDDNMMPVENAFLAFARMANAELHLFSGCGHWAQVERKVAFERLVIEFLTRD